MLLILMRHGKAEPKKSGISDFERELTEVSRLEVSLVAKLFPVKPSVIFTSPLKRAVQTAEEVSRVLEGVEIKVDWRLEPERASLSSLRDLDILSYSSAVVIGHAPSIEEIASSLIGGCRIKIIAGSALGLELDDIDLGKGLLKFFITPEIASRA